MLSTVPYYGDKIPDNKKDCYLLLSPYPGSEHHRNMIAIDIEHADILDEDIIGMLREGRHASREQIENKFSHLH